jgi:photosystem II stability/assembly factor-like uncharacterized protein
MRRVSDFILMICAMLVLCGLCFPADGSAQHIQAVAEGVAAPCHLYDIASISDQEAWAVSERGFALHTTDAGKTWESQRLDVNVPLRALAFADARRGFIVGNSGLLLATNDGGRNWKRHPIPARNQLTSVFAIGEQVWVAGYWGIILRTIDGGKTWERQQASNQPVEGIFFLNPKLGWVVGWYGLVLHTTDGGQSWQRQSTPRSTRTLNAVYFRDERNGWAVGTLGLILRTDDGGRTWKRQASPVADKFTDVIFSSTGRGIIAGINSILASDDGGGTWQRQSYFLPEPIFALAASGQQMWRAGNGQIAVSADDGRNWSARNVMVKDSKIIVAN